MQIEFTRAAAKSFRKVPRHIAERIIQKLESLTETGPESTPHDVRKLTGREGYRLRVGDWRVIFTADGIVLLVLKVAPRGDAYKR